jgi:hypothetical protein
MDEEAALALFRTHMKTEVIPILLQDAISSPQEEELLIKSQWTEMSPAEKTKWLSKVTAAPSTSFLVNRLSRRFSLRVPY